MVDDIESNNPKEDKAISASGTDVTDTNVVYTDISPLTTKRIIAATVFLITTLLLISFWKSTAVKGGISDDNSWYYKTSEDDSNWKMKNRRKSSYLEWLLLPSLGCFSCFIKTREDRWMSPRTRTNLSRVQNMLSGYLMKIQVPKTRSVLNVIRTLCTGRS